MLTQKELVFCLHTGHSVSMSVQQGKKKRTLTVKLLTLWAKIEDPEGWWRGIHCELCGLATGSKGVSRSYLCVTGCGSECDSSAVLRCWKRSVGPDALRNQGSCRWGLRRGSTQPFFLCCHGHEPSGTQGLTIREIAVAPCLLGHICGPHLPFLWQRRRWWQWVP